MVGGAVGLALAWVLLRVAPSLVPPNAIPSDIALTLDWRLAVFALLMTLLTVLLFGFAPAWQAARVSLVEAMNTGGRGASDRSGRARSSLAVLEIAVALLLMTGAGLLVRTLVSLNEVDAGYRAERVVTMSIRLPFRRLITARPGANCRVLAVDRGRRRRRPSDSHRVARSDLPLSGIGVRQPFEIVGSPAPDPANRPLAHYNVVGPGYFDALGIPFVRGRAFTERDSETTPAVSIVNEAFVRGSWPAAIRSVHVSRSRSPASAPDSRIVRLSASCVRSRRGRTRPADSVYQIYVPTAQSPWVMANLIVRTADEPLQIVEQVKRAIARVDPTQAVSQVRTMERWPRSQRPVRGSGRNWSWSLQRWRRSWPQWGSSAC